jgi:hypothetical protein
MTKFEVNVIDRWTADQLTKSAQTIIDNLEKLHPSTFKVVSAEVITWDERPSGVHHIMTLICSY